jgi:hypothetical protein
MHAVCRACMPVVSGMLWLCLSASASPAASATNLLANPGFENTRSDHPWMPAAWDTFQSGLNTVFFGRDTLLVHGGRYAVNVANVSTLVPMWHNWSQVVPVDPSMWGKDMVLTVWSRNNGLQGRAYVLLQAFRDSAQKMALIWKLPRDSAATRMGILKTSDPYVSLGWQREYFSEPETDWVRRQLRVHVAPSTNVVFVRCGIHGTGQVLFDDASLALEPAEAQPPVPLHTNLLRDPGFEGDGNDWEYSMPPYEGMRIERDTTVRHGGRASVRFEGGLGGPVPVRAGVCQVVSNRNLAGKRVRLTAHCKTDSLMGLAYVKVYFTTIDGDVHAPTPQQLGTTTDWTKVVMEVDAPPNTLATWAWFLYNAPAAGRVYYDDVSLEAIGPADYIRTGAEPPKPLPLPAR